MPDLQIESGGAINPEKNKWGADKDKYQESIGGAGFAFRNLSAPEKNSGADPEKNRGADPEGKGKIEDPYSFHQGGDKPADPSFVEKTPDQQYQEMLQQAAQKGLPVVVVFGSQTAMDTEKQSTQTIKQNMKEGEAVYLYVDTDKLDPNSDLGKVARRNATAGQGLGESGKADLAFTGVYTVEKKADGSLGLGKSVATFWGGRDEISPIMREQLKYAKAATLNLGGDTTPQPESKPAPGDNKPHPPQDQRPQPSIRPSDESPSPPQPDGRPSDEQQVRPDAKPDRPEERPADQNKDSDKKDEQEREEQKRKDDEKAKERLKRQKEIQTAGGGKDYTLDQYATGWGRFLERSEMEPGPLRDALDEFGKEMITGEFDGKKLADLMSKIEPSDREKMAQTLERANEELEASGLELNVELDPKTGRVAALELSEKASDGRPRTSVSATAGGDIKSGILTGQGLRETPLPLASLRLAKKAEPAACP